MAGFNISSGTIVVTLDADLQNPPEEIPKLVKMIEAEHDVVGSIRVDRHRNVFSDRDISADQTMKRSRVKKARLAEVLY